MKKMSKNAIIIILGFIGGMASWPLLELVLAKQSAFNNYSHIDSRAVSGIIYGLW